MARAKAAEEERKRLADAKRLQDLEEERRRAGEVRRRMQEAKPHATASVIEILQSRALAHEP